MKIDVPFFKQDTEYSCGAAATQMLLAFHHIRKSEEELMQLLGTDKEYGTHHQAIIELLTSEGLYCYVNDSSSLEEVQEFLRRDLPAMVHYIEPDDDDPHYALIIGIDDTHVIMNDPWLGEGFRMQKHTFEKRWHDEAAAFPRWLLIASMEDLNIGKQYLPA